MQAERIRFSGFAPISEVHLYGKIFSRNSSAPISEVPRFQRFHCTLYIVWAFNKFQALFLISEVHGDTLTFFTLLKSSEVSPLISI